MFMKTVGRSLLLYTHYIAKSWNLTACVCVRATTISGDVVSEIVLGRDASLNRWEHVPEPFFRIAEDGNLYTREEFQDYYGHKACDRWASAFPCYEHAISVIVDDGALSRLSALAFLHRRTHSSSSCIYR